MGLGQYEDFSQVEHRNYQPTIKAGKSEIEKAVSMIASAKKPLFIAVAALSTPALRRASSSAVW